MEKQIVVNQELVAYCGLYCGSCRQYLKNACLGCHRNERATWCKIRSCCVSNGLQSCADCHTNVADCKKFTNFVSKVFSLIFNSNRQACIDRIKLIGYEAYAKEMTENRVQTIKRK